jgi:hypothetical protein
MSLERAYSTHERDEECMQGFGGKPDEKRSLGCLDVGGWKILKWIF